MVEEEVTPQGFYQRETSVKRKNWKRAVAAILTVGAGLLVAGYFLWPSKNDEASPEGAAKVTQMTAKVDDADPNTVTMLATGDFIAHDAINLRAENDDGSYDYSPMMQDMEPIFKKTDIRFCNQATLAGGEQYGITGYPVFNAPFEWIHDMVGLGCNVINTGTNHTNDKGQGPITAQANEWDKQPNILAVAGSNRSAEEQAKVRYFEVKGVKFAFLSYSTYSNVPNPNPYSLNRFSDEIVVPQMTEAKQQADIIIVSMRWGTEYSEVINAAQDQQAQKLTNLGADIILGHGTHTLQPVKRLKGTLPDGFPHESVVWFGLGNFLNAQLETTGLTGCVAQFSIDVATKKLKETSCLPFYMHYEWTADEKAREDMLARKNFRIVPLDKAADYIAKSQLDTTVEEQTKRISLIVNTYTEVFIRISD